MTDVTERARGLLGRLLHGHGVVARITEVEAYGGIEDPASHAFKRTPRSEIMYGAPWRLYVYRIHGHHAANVVTGPTEQAAAVLIRAGEIVEGFDLAHERRGPVAEHALGRGPGNLTKALGITSADLGTDLLDPEPVFLGDRVETPRIVAGPRVGVRLNADAPWRFWVADDPTVSAYRRHPRAGVTPSDAGDGPGPAARR